MTELALHILDIAHNSIAAKATLIRIGVEADSQKNALRITIADDGCGMDADLLKRVADPFSTTRTTRRVGLGIPLFKAAAETAGGSFAIESAVGAGTTTSAVFRLDHIDRVPLGDLTETVAALIYEGQTAEIELTYIVDGRTYVFDTREIKAVLGGGITDAVTLTYLKDMLRENMTEINGGLEI